MGQGYLNGASKDDIERECAELLRWGTKDGGLIISPQVFDCSEETERIVYNYFFSKNTD